MVAAQRTLRGAVHHGFLPEQLWVKVGPEALGTNSTILRVNPHAHPLGFSPSEKVQINIYC